ncbi:unnamed protein product [Protopolystoma xenopodis]|uniref:Uncharacterized protein n=1 Tax=Protopolystoma xenopodis TaxID=117903 RepID=A0A3S5APB9_9PLAT|nr:unnamed protein product [Protopolystoma xenopodis]
MKLTCPWAEETGYRVNQKPASFGLCSSSRRFREALRPEPPPAIFYLSSCLDPARRQLATIISIESTIQPHLGSLQHSAPHISASRLLPTAFCLRGPADDLQGSYFGSGNPGYPHQLLADSTGCQTRVGIVAKKGTPHYLYISKEKV